VSKSTIFSTIDVTILHGEMVKTTCLVIKTMKKWFVVIYVAMIVTNISLDENEDEKWTYIIYF
jgi:hypothetical protein